MNQVVHLPLNKAQKSKTVKAKASARAPTRTNDPERTMAGILDVATVEFAEKGLDGARIDEIAAATKTSKRMIYYYFSSKEGLYRAVLEDMYRRMRSIESGLHLADLPPVEALQKLVSFTFDHHHSNENFIRLVMSENMQRGAYLSQSKSIQDLNVPAIAAIQELYERGVVSGVFRAGLDPVDIHASISALTFFNVSNKHTFGLIFKQDPAVTNAITTRRNNVIEMVLRYMRA
ncbi:MAG: TetR/AcrR family transcriptional regulator [Rhodoferax sp.]|uniref:TetR/AcrR family transcriptional regulator n=1 Tax=Rhodoferax sp. TaxID=50421 RepID=UPI0008B23BF3|nr:TetR/AcrR family transcriptional regulator [Rhodoferax sp.]MDP2680001.1 TetR/AcrR family transcriptional regulator [Rhodoferax sp.]OGB51655.1 MAG: TetR family transcriptional regulator [Burkholderiales bacterium RIFOXYD12_FULL_59_19]OGB86049.1 MAG: TetR family transcriptional regulator [Burkholderiales bacterium RIFOXYD2_FULL_59_8]